MKTQIKTLILLVAIGTLTSGCATILNGTTQSVSLETSPVDGAKCRLQNSEGSWFLTTPGSVVVHKTKHNLDISCKKDGYKDAHVFLVPSFNFDTIGNVLVGGLAGITVDAFSGANWAYSTANIVPLIPVGE